MKLSGQWYVSFGFPTRHAHLLDGDKQHTRGYVMVCGTIHNGMEKMERVDIEQMPVDLVCAACAATAYGRHWTAEYYKKV